ncbi:MAG: hypothetical protein ACYC35_27090 [Pirellulales bacterium]
MRRTLTGLVVGAVLLPIVVSTLWAVGLLLAAMEDRGGATVVEQVSLAVRVLWIVDLVLLVVVQGIHAVVSCGERAAEREEVEE